MAGYLGNKPVDKYVSLETQHFNVTATATYTLINSVTNADEISLFINNVHQESGGSYAYTAAGTTLTLSAATAATDTMYCVYLGRSVGTISPPDGSVSDVKITNMSASKLTGTIAGARLPDPLPAISGAALTGVESAVKSASDPTITSNRTLGTEWINTTSGEVYILTTDTTNLNVWTNVGDGTGTIQPNDPPSNPTDDFPDLTESTTTAHTFSGATDADGTVTHYKVDTISNSSLLAVTTAEVAAGTAHSFITQAVSANTNVTFRVRAKDNLGAYSSGITVTTAIANTYTSHFLVVAGGGSGGGGQAGGAMSCGAGAGGVRTSWAGGSGGGGASESQIIISPGTVYTISVGAGATGVSSTTFVNGVDSFISGTGLTTKTSLGGGYGAVNKAGGNGGSGGGGSGSGQGETGQGYDGANDSGWPLGGGGGAGGLGKASPGTSTTAGEGGVGKQINIDTNNWYWGGGGGGGLHGGGSAGPGGLGGGGGGSAYCNSGQTVGAGGGSAINSGAAGLCNTSGAPGGTGGTNSGGGGGGANDSASRGTHGGSGIIILRMATSDYSGTHTGNETPTTSGSDTIVTWKGVGTYTG